MIVYLSLLSLKLRGIKGNHKMNRMIFCLTVALFSIGCRTTVNLPSVVETPEQTYDLMADDKIERDHEYLSIQPPTSQISDIELKQREAERASLRNKLSRTKPYDDAEVVYLDGEYEIDPDSIEEHDDPGAWSTSVRVKRKTQKH